MGSGVGVMVGSTSLHPPYMNYGYSGNEIVAPRMKVYGGILCLYRDC